MRVNTIKLSQQKCDTVSRWIMRKTNGQSSSNDSILTGTALIAAFLWNIISALIAPNGHLTMFAANI